MNRVTMVSLTTTREELMNTLPQNVRQLTTWMRSEEFWLFSHSRGIPRKPRSTSLPKCASTSAEKCMVLKSTSARSRLLIGNTSMVVKPRVTSRACGEANQESGDALPPGE